MPLVFDYDRVTSVQIFNALKDISNNPFLCHGGGAAGGDRNNLRSQQAAV